MQTTATPADSIRALPAAAIEAAARADLEGTLALLRGLD